MYSHLAKSSRKRILISLIMLAVCANLAAQSSVKGKVFDKLTDEPIAYVNVKVSPQGQETLIKGAVTDTEGNFIIENLDYGQYTLTLTFIGYKTLKRNFSLSSSHSVEHFSRLYMSEDSRMLKEVEVTGQKSGMKLEVDRKSFDVSQLISNAGDAASDVLDNIPSVEVDNDGNISLRGNTSVEVWINGKASGLTTDNRSQILEQLPAESIEKIEVIDNPSAKFSAEGSAGIINIVLKKDRKPGYYGSVQAGFDTRGGANTSFNINYSSPVIDYYFNIGYRHRENVGKEKSRQENYKTNEYHDLSSRNKHLGNNIFTRAGITLHATKHDDVSLSGMFMNGKHKNWSLAPYNYYALDTDILSKRLTRDSRSSGRMRMLQGEIDYRHNFSDKHFLDCYVSFDRWKSNDGNIYYDLTEYYPDMIDETLTDVYIAERSYQYRPLHINNRSWEAKLDYENEFSERFKLQAGYQGRFSHENTPQESFVDSTTYNGQNLEEDKTYFNRFIYSMDVHALYATATLKFGPFGIMGGLRGEYWKVDTESYTWEQEHDASLRQTPFKKDYFQLFPSLFLSYQITENDQLQLNYTRRLRRPWGGQLNNFKDTRDASVITYGNPELTPEYSNSFSLNYLKTWTEHSLMLSAYYRPTTDVIQRLTYQDISDGLMYSTSENVAKSLSTGLELVVKNKLFRIVDLTTTANAYYYKLDGFSYNIGGQTVNGEGNHNFSWNARTTVSVILPYDISVQASGRYRSKQVITQGYRKANYSVDLGARKNFFNKMFTLSVNCRDLFNSRKWESVTESDTFLRHSVHKRGGRKVNVTLTWNFGNTKAKKKPRNDMEEHDDDEQQSSGYGNM